MLIFVQLPKFLGYYTHIRQLLKCEAKTILSLISKNKKTNSQPKTISCKENTLLNSRITPNALRVLHGLKEAGFKAYIVGGGIRDLLLELKPKDFDIVTDAKPEQIRKIFRNCILIGRRFRLAHVRFGREIIEVATFRGVTAQHSDKYKCSEHGMLIRDNIYGTIEEDVWRRDFTINALYYCINNFSVIDYVGGTRDLESKTIRVIGDPAVRYREDPVRMLRAIRMAAKLGFDIDKKAAKPITKLAPLFINVSVARLFEEVLKWFLSGKSFEIYKLLCQYKLFEFLFAQTAVSLHSKYSEKTAALLQEGFVNTDKRISEDKSVNPAFLFAVLLWWPLQENIALLKEQKTGSDLVFLQQAMQNVFKVQKKQTMLPQKIVLTIKDIWRLQFHFERKKKARVKYILAHPKFRAAYDFLLLRAQAGEKVQDIAGRWTALQEIKGNE